MDTTDNSIQPIEERQQALERLRKLRDRPQLKLPVGFKFDREEANERPWQEGFLRKNPAKQ